MAKASSKTSAPTINIGISEKDRAAIAQGLSRLLADTYTLYLTTHNFSNPPCLAITFLFLNGKIITQK